jgi:hypothetical protein
MANKHQHKCSNNGAVRKLTLEAHLETPGHPADLVFVEAAQRAVEFQPRPISQEINFLLQTPGLRRRASRVRDPV